MKIVPANTRFWARAARRAAAAAAIGCCLILLGASSSATARVVFPKPGALRVTDMPSKVTAGAMLTMRETLPLAVLGGSAVLQLRRASGGWRPLASGATRPWLFWLHWRVPAGWGRKSLQVRFILVARGRLLAVSPDYPLTVTGAAR